MPACAGITELTELWAERAVKPPAALSTNCWEIRISSASSCAGLFFCHKKITSLHSMGEDYQRAAHRQTLHIQAVIYIQCKLCNLSICTLTNTHTQRLPQCYKYCWIIVCWTYWLHPRLHHSAWTVGFVGSKKNTCYKVYFSCLRLCFQVIKCLWNEGTKSVPLTHWWELTWTLTSTLQIKKNVSTLWYQNMSWQSE